jgi:hypothetical protein
MFSDTCLNFRVSDVLRNDILFVTLCNSVDCVKIDIACLWGFHIWFPCAAWEPILDALHPVEQGYGVLYPAVIIRRAADRIMSEGNMLSIMFNFVDLWILY